VTISGKNFLGGTVQFNGLNASLVSLNNTQMIASVPVGAQTGPIAVSGPAGSGTSSQQFVLDYPSTAPLLSIGQNGGLITVSWPASLTNYLLQYQDFFGPAAQWLTFSNAPSTSGASLFINDTNNGSGRFYRLRQ
jgi:hypothetical protein